MQPLGALVGPTAGNRGRIVPEHGLRRGIALAQAHNLPLAKVNRRKNDEPMYSLSERMTGKVR